MSITRDELPPLELQARRTPGHARSRASRTRLDGETATGTRADPYDRSNNDASISRSAVVFSALFIILGGFFLGGVIFPLFHQPRSLIPVVAGPAEFTVPGDSAPTAPFGAPSPLSPSFQVGEVSPNPAPGPTDTQASAADGRSVFAQPAPTSGALPNTGNGPLFPYGFLQVGAFENLSNAQSVAAELLQLRMTVHLIPTGDLVKVQVGPFRSAEERAAGARLLQTHGFPFVQQALDY